MTDWQELIAPMGVATAVAVAASLAMQFDVAQGAGRSPLIGPPWLGGLACIVSFAAFAIAARRRAATDSFSEAE